MADLIHVKRRLSSLSPAPPPPSPIPNIRDSPSDSAAAANIFRFHQNIKIDRSKVLSLPDYVRRSVMAGIDYQLLLSGDKHSINWLLRSAAEFGVFRISNHGLSAEDLRTTLTEESEWVFGLSSEFRRRVDDHREEFMWCRSGETSVAKRGKEVVGIHKYRTFRQEIENVASKLETIAEELGHIFSTNASKLQSRKEIQPSEATLSLSRHNQHPSTLRGHSLHSSYHKTQQEDSCKHALSLHFPVDRGQFCIHSEQSPSSFNTGPDTIVITIGGQLAEWSKGEFKSAYGEVNFKPELQGNKTSFSFELKCSPSNLIRGVCIKRTISLVDQIVIILIVVILYRIVTLMWF